MKLQLLEARDGITYQEVNKLLNEVGWGNPYYATPQVWQNNLSISTQIAYVRKKERLTEGLFKTVTHMIS